MEQPEEPVSYMSGKLTGSGGIYNVTVTVGEDAEIPEGATLSVTALTEADDAWQEAYQLVNPGEGKGFAALDISILDAAGEKIEPKASVDVQIELTQPFDDMTADSRITIQHVNKSFGEEPVLEFVTNRNGGSSGMVTVDEDAVQTWLDEAADWAKKAESWLEGLENWLNSEAAKELQKEFKENPPIVAKFTVSSFSTFTITYSNGASLTVHVVSKNTVSHKYEEIPGALVTNPDSTTIEDGWVSIDAYRPAIDDGRYKYAGVYADSVDGDTIHYINYHDGSFWYSSAADGADEKVLSDIYFVYSYVDGLVGLTLNVNGGTGADVPEQIRAISGSKVTLPGYEGTRTGYSFVGWMESKYTFERPETSYRKVYTPGSLYDMPDKDTELYAVWSNNDPRAPVTGWRLPIYTTANFFIRTDGKIPSEPGRYPNGPYVSVSSVEKNVKYMCWVIDNDTTKPIADGKNYVENDVAKAQNSLPSDNEIQKACGIDQDGNYVYNPETHYVLWYVQKYHIDGWHIDGIILKRDNVQLSYDANVPRGEDAEVDVPLGCDVPPGTLVTVGASGNDPSNIVIPEISGYQFLGWNTKANGAGDWYQTGTQMTLSKSVKLYAQWAKNENNVLSLQKVDALGYPVGGAFFELTKGDGKPQEFPVDNNGRYTKYDIETGTVYTIRETQAPEGYEGLKAPFYFKVANVGGKLEAYLCDKDGKKATDTTGKIDLSFANGTVNITVKNTGYFYVFHSSTGETETFDITGNFNIVDLVNNRHTDPSQKYLYGGYYTDYGGKDAKDTDGKYIPYTGASSQLGYWNGQKACPDSGLSFVPKAGETYYLKEVPETYLNPATYVVYDDYASDKPIKTLYLVTATDDSNYLEVGLSVTGTGKISSKETDVTTVAQNTWHVNKKGPVLHDSFTSKKVFGSKCVGYLAVSESKDAYVSAGSTYVETPYFVTPDGVKVNGTQRMKVYLGNATFTEWTGSGITKVGIPAVSRPAASNK